MNKVNRRSFVRHATILGVSLGVGQVLLASCTQAPAAPTSAPPPPATPTTAAAATVAPAATTAPAPATAAPAAAPTVLPSPTPVPTATGGLVRGGTLYESLNISTERFVDPAVSVSVPQSNAYRQVCDWLVRVTPELKVEPALATKWMPSSDGLKWTIELRKGVKFNHGKAFTADDVVFTFNRLLDPNVKSGFRSVANYLPQTGAIEKLDDFTVVFHTTRPVADFPYHLHDYHAPILPADWTGDFFKAPWGTGPFTIKDWQPKQSVTYQARKDYWRTAKDGKPTPLVDEIQVTVYPDDASYLDAVKKGKVSLGSLALPLMPQILQMNTIVRPLVFQTNHFWNGVMHCDEKPFSDVRVRQALKIAVDRAQYIKTALVGYGIPANDQPVGPIYPIAPTIAPPKQDVAKAKQLLADAGYPNGVDIQVFHPDDSGHRNIGEWLQQSAAPAGFRLTLKPRPDYYQIWLNKWGDNVMGLDNWAARATASEFFNIAYKSDGVWNETHYTNKQFDELLAQSDAELDQAKQKSLYQKMADLLSSDGGVLVPAWRQDLQLANVAVQGYVPNPTNAAYYDEIWLKAQ